MIEGTLEVMRQAAALLGEIGNCYRHKEASMFSFRQGLITQSPKTQTSDNLRSPYRGVTDSIPNSAFIAFSSDSSLRNILGGAGRALGI